MRCYKYSLAILCVTLTLGGFCCRTDAQNPFPTCVLVQPSQDQWFQTNQFGQALVTVESQEHWVSISNDMPYQYHSVSWHMAVGVVGAGYYAGDFAGYANIMTDQFGFWQRKANGVGWLWGQAVFNSGEYTAYAHSDITIAGQNTAEANDFHDFSVGPG